MSSAYSVGGLCVGGGACVVMCVLGGGDLEREGDGDRDLSRFVDVVALGVANYVEAVAIHICRPSEYLGGKRHECNTHHQVSAFNTSNTL